MSKPAFPRPYSEWHEEGIKHELPQQQGMSLLEFYTGQALIGITSRVACDDAVLTEIARTALKIAEATIKELENSQ